MSTASGSTSPDPPDEPVTLELSPAQHDVLGALARAYAAAAPQGWLRVVVRHECSTDPEIRGRVAVRQVVVLTPQGLVQERCEAPDDMHFEIGDLLDELAEQSPTRTVVLHLVVDRDGTWSGRVEQDVPRVLAGIRDDTSSKPVHEHLERNRAELEELAARTR